MLGINIGSIFPICTRWGALRSKDQVLTFRAKACICILNILRLAGIALNRECLTTLVANSSDDVIKLVGSSTHHADRGALEVPVIVQARRLEAQPDTAGRNQPRC